MASGTITGTTSNKYIDVRIAWTSSSNVSANTSTVTATLSYRKSSASTSKTYGTYSGELNIAGTITTFKKKVTLNDDDTWVEIGSDTVTITHNADGSKSISMSASGKISGTTLSSTTCSGTATLDTIPRATTPTTSGTLNVGSSITINTPRASSAFTHTVQYSLNNSTWTNIATGVGTSTTWTLPAALATAKTTAKSGTVYIRCITYNGSSNIGDKVISRTYNITSSYASPSVALAVSQTNSAGISLYIDGKSTVTLTATATLKYSAKAAKYVFKLGSTTKTVTSTSSTASATFTVPVHSSVSEGYSVTLTDSRGYTASKSGSVSTVTYTAPQISSFSAVRGDYDGDTFTENNKGNSLMISASGSILSLENENAKTYKVEYRLANVTGYTTLIDTKNAADYSATITEYTDAIFSENAAYVLRLTLADSFEKTMFVVDVPSQRVLMNFSANGKAMGIGGAASIDDNLNVALGLHLTGGITPIVLADETDFDEIVKTGWYIGNASTGKYLNCPITSGTFTLEVMSAGSDGQLYQNLDYCSKADYTAYKRFYYQSEWGSWIDPHSTIPVDVQIEIGDVKTTASNALSKVQALEIEVANNSAILPTLEWKSGDKLTLSSHLSFSGYATGSSQTIYFTIPVGKPIRSTHVYITQGTLAIRGTDGYISEATYSAPMDIGLGTNFIYTVGVSIASAEAGLLSVYIEKDSAFGNVANNTPLSVMNMSDMILSFINNDVTDPET